MTNRDPNQPAPETSEVQAAGIKPAPAGDGTKIPAWLVAGFLVVITVALYWPVTHADFVGYDDPDYVQKNPWVQTGLTLKNAGWAFTTGLASNWHPLTWLSLMADASLFGKTATVFHSVNLAFHALNTLLVFCLLRRLTGALWPSAFAAAFFAWHPMHVESVAWISERKDVLSAFFGFLSLIFYTRYAQSPASRPRPNYSYILSLLCFALGLMSKSMLVTWPFVMLLLDYWPLGRLSPFQLSAFGPQLFRLIREKIPFAVLSVAVSVVVLLVQQHGGAVRTTDAIPIGMRVPNAIVSYCRYLGKLFWPVDLAVYYPYPGLWPMARVLPALCLLAAVSAWVLWQRRRYPFLLMGWLWFAGTLVPVIGLVQAGDQAMADRYSYIPSLGIFIMVIWGGLALVRSGRPSAAFFSAAGIAAIVGCGCLTRQQLVYWQSSEALFRHALAVTKDNNVAHNNLGIVFIDQGNIDAAIAEFQEAARIAPQGPVAHGNLMQALAVKSRRAAIDRAREGLRQQPDSAAAHNDLGLAFARDGQLDAAIREFQAALALKPNFAEADNNLGIALFQQGHTDEAISQFQASLKLEPDFVNAHNNLGSAFTKEARWDEAIIQFQAALRLKPDFAQAQANLKRALAEKSRSTNQVSHSVKP